MWQATSHIPGLREMSFRRHQPRWKKTIYSTVLRRWPSLKKQRKPVWHMWHRPNPNQKHCTTHATDLTWVKVVSNLMGSIPWTCLKKLKILRSTRSADAQIRHKWSNCRDRTIELRRSFGFVKWRRMQLHKVTEPIRGRDPVMSNSSFVQSFCFFRFFAGRF